MHTVVVIQYMFIIVFVVLNITHYQTYKCYNTIPLLLVAAGNAIRHA